MSWRVTTLGDLVRIEHGFAFKGEFFASSGRQIVLTPGNFHEEGGFRARPGKDRYYAGEFPERYVLEEDALIVAMTEQGEGLLGSAALVPASETYLHNQRIGRVKERREFADRRFLYYLLNTNQVRQQIRNSSSGTKVRHTSPERMYSAAVEVPGVPVQRKIAGILAAYDDLIANNQRRIALLESMAEEIYREWFVRMRFPGYRGVPTEKGVPLGWGFVPAKEAFEFFGGATPSKDVARYWKDGVVNWFTPTDITGAAGMFLERSKDRCSEEGLENCSARIFPSHSVMLTSRATIGAIGINLTPACTNQGFISCIPNARYPLSFLYHWLKLAKPHFELLAGGSTFPELTKGTFKRLQVLTPPAGLVSSFDLVVSPQFQIIEALLKTNERLKATRDALLPRLISGKLKVDHLDIQFPPSMREKVTA